MSYLYETHLHTSYASACGISTGAEYVRQYKKMGYTGIIVTDHFYNGNTAISRSLPWKEWVNEFCRGYEETRNEGERQGLDVFFGWEETFDNCDDYLIYGLDKAWLMEHPEAKNWSRGEQYRAVKAAGGCVVQAHPFRQHNYIHKVILSAGCVDGVEAANAGNYEQSYDALAMRYAKKNGLPVTAGSDMHDARQICNEWLFGVYTEKKLETIADYVNVVCNNGISDIKTSEGRCDYHGNETVRIPVDIRDSNDRSTGKNWKKLLA
jgi:histidinol phosphatase-like PHP family hydrolase